MDVALVTAADARFGPLLFDLLRSVRAFPAFSALPLHVLDVGLNPEQQADLRQMSVTVISAGYDIPGVQPPRVPPFYRAFSARPFLPRYLPDAALLVWLDADTWLATPDALHLLIASAATGDLAIIPELDRAYGHCFHDRAAVTRLMDQLYRLGWSNAIADRLREHPVLNSGAFALRADSPLWSHWQRLAAEAYTRTLHHLVEQTALNVAAYVAAAGEVRTHYLPAWCNWMCNKALPLFDPAARRLLHPFAPHEPLSLVHLSEIKAAPVPLPCTDGRSLSTPLTRSALITP